MKQGRPPGSKPDEKDVPKPAEPAPGKKSLVDTNTTAAPKPAQPVTAVPTTAHATKKRHEADDWQPRWSKLQSFTKRRRSDDDEEKKDEEEKDEEEQVEAAGDQESKVEEKEAETQAEQDVTKTPD